MLARLRQLLAGHDARDDQVARGSPRERPGEREESLEAPFVRKRHEERAPRGSGGLRSELRILAEDRLLELLQRRAGIDAELLDERAARILIRLERLGLPP